MGETVKGREVQARGYGMGEPQGWKAEHEEYSQCYRDSEVTGQMAATLRWAQRNVQSCQIAVLYPSNQRGVCVNYTQIKNERTDYCARQWFPLLGSLLIPVSTRRIWNLHYSPHGFSPVRSLTPATWPPPLPGPSFELPDSPFCLQPPSSHIGGRKVLMFLSEITSNRLLKSTIPALCICCPLPLPRAGRTPTCFWKLGNAPTQLLPQCPTRSQPQWTPALTATETQLAVGKTGSEMKLHHHGQIHRGSSAKFSTDEILQWAQLRPRATPDQHHPTFVLSSLLGLLRPFSGSFSYQYTSSVGVS